jgi:hypothetical protein
MAQASKKHMGAGSQGKGSGAGGLTDAPAIADNQVLSNRDKAQHPNRDKVLRPDGRGQDSKWVQTEQMQDHEANQRKD